MRRRNGIAIASLVTLCGSLGLAAGARAQGLELSENAVRFEDASGNQQASLAGSFLNLGGNGAVGFIQVLTSSGGAQLQTDANNALTSIWGELRLYEAFTDKVKLTLDGDAGDITTIGGDIVMKDLSNIQNIRLQGSGGGTASNGLPGNGFVKGWARIGSDGSVLSCYNCDQDSMLTRRTALGTYYVGFSPIGDDISSRPRMAIPDKFDATIAGSPKIGLQTDTGDLSRIRVNVGPAEDHSFTIIVF